jgi:hypothetical protein
MDYMPTRKGRVVILEADAKSGKRIVRQLDCELGNHGREGLQRHLNQVYLYRASHHCRFRGTFSFPVVQVVRVCIN